MQTVFLENEYWFGGIVDEGRYQPYSEKTVREIALDGKANDQRSPVFFSTKGRIIRSDKPFTLKFEKGVIKAQSRFSEVILEEGFGNLKGAVIHAAKSYAKGSMPNFVFLTKPQYNTWIEFGYNQNEKGILEYAESIIKNGMPAGIFMIDEGWSEDYGIFDFYPGRFSDPRGMIEKLHTLGFKVMLWVTPYISPDGPSFRELSKKGYLINNSSGNPAVRKWWNGYSCAIDLTNPDAAAWYKEKLDGVIRKYGNDGFKFDAADYYFYAETDNTYKKCLPLEQTKAYNEFAKQYSYNELRAVWDMSGEPLVCRLQDKNPTFDGYGLETIIPHTVLQGMLGYYYCCPDMIGGGNIGSSYDFDDNYRELYMRWLEASSLCPMMQFSIAPWRVQTAENFEKVKEYAALHEKYGEYILSLAKHASKTGEPIVRHLCYEFPDEDFENCNTAFMLGDKFLVAPVLLKGASEKTVTLPCGKWKYDGKIFDGGREYTVSAPLDVLPVFERVFG